MNHRWMAEIYYTEGDVIIDYVSFEELEDLHDIVESGPDWNTIEKIVVYLNHPSGDPKRLQVVK